MSVYTSLNNQTDKEEPPTKKRRFFTETENGLISDYFKPSKDTKPPNSDRAQAFLKEHQKGGNFSGRSLQHIQDKVKTRIIPSQDNYLQYVVRGKTSISCLHYPGASEDILFD